MAANSIVATVLIIIGIILSVYGIKISLENQMGRNVAFIISGALLFIVGVTFFVSNIGSSIKILFLHVMTLL